MSQASGRLCTACGASKSPDDFRLRKKRGKTVRSTTCRPCERAYNRRYHERNRESILKKRRETIKPDRVCSLCLVFKPSQEYRKRASRCRECQAVDDKNYHASRRDTRNNLAKERVRRIVSGVLDILGRHCTGCGETEEEFLTVDHVNNDRQSERRPNSLVWKADIISGVKDLSDYRVLCRNCNEARQRLNPTQLLKSEPIIGETKLCKTCMREIDLSFFRKRGYNRRSHCSSCMRVADFQIAVACYNFLGGVCRCCGESDSHKLNVDHVHDDGNVRRRTGMEKTGVSLYRKILRGELRKSDFQVLCANCNYSKMRHGGVCIHSLIPREAAS